MQEGSFSQELTQSECRIRAAFYRHLALSVETAEARAALLKLAEKYAAKAADSPAAD